MDASKRHVGTLALLALGASILPTSGCSAEATPEPDDPSVAWEPTVLGEMVAHVDPRAGTITFVGVERPRLTPHHGLAPQSLDEVPVAQDGVAGTGPANTVELVTNSVGYDKDCPPGYRKNTFCGNVTLRHFYGRTINNAYVQVTAVRDANRQLLSDHGGINGDASALGLDATYGLWAYTSSAATTTGVLGMSPYHWGDRDWVFANPDNADTWIYLRVVASLGYASYTWGSSLQSYVDACATPGGVNLGQPGGTSYVTTPFPITLYGVTSSALSLSRKGMMSFGSAALPEGANASLPNATGAAPRPGIFPFWDDITYNASGSSLCHVTTGSAPNRKLVVTWKNMRFATSTGSDQLTFSAYLSEGTNRVDFVYATMTSTSLPARAAGSTAVVGVQNEVGAVATGGAVGGRSTAAGTKYGLAATP